MSDFDLMPNNENHEDSVRIVYAELFVIDPFPHSVVLVRLAELSKLAMNSRQTPIPVQGAWRVNMNVWSLDRRNPASLGITVPFRPLVQ